MKNAVHAADNDTDALHEMSRDISFHRIGAQLVTLHICIAPKKMFYKNSLTVMTLCYDRR